MSTPSNWLLYCRAGFERDCWIDAGAQAQNTELGEGWVRCQHIRPEWSRLAFARQVIKLVGEVTALPERDRLTPLLAALPAQPQAFSAVWLEVPDTSEGKTLSGFTRRFTPLLETTLRAQQRLDTARPDLPRLHIFFPTHQRALLGISDPALSAPWPMGILRLRMPADAPSRSTLKLAEAIEVLVEDKHALRAGMTAVDLGAAPGGWTWQLVRRGIKVCAVDNGPLKGSVAIHPLVQHTRADGFKFQPRHPVDWLVCDMVEQPQRVAALIAQWIVKGWARRALFNLKLPMKKRSEALAQACALIDDSLRAEGIAYSLRAKQLYHDREEVTLYLARTNNKGRRKPR